MGRWWSFNAKHQTVAASSITSTLRKERNAYREITCVEMLYIMYLSETPLDTNSVISHSVFQQTLSGALPTWTYPHDTLHCLVGLHHCEVHVTANSCSASWCSKTIEYAWSIPTSQRVDEHPEIGCFTSSLLSLTGPILGAMHPTKLSSSGWKQKSKLILLVDLLRFRQLVSILTLLSLWYTSIAMIGDQLV